MNEETLFEFPCQFPIKVMGKATDDFTSLVVDIVSEHVDDIDSAMIKTRPSGKGNYVAVTVTITATSKQQLDNIYLALSAREEILMSL